MQATSLFFLLALALLVFLALLLRSLLRVLHDHQRVVSVLGHNHLVLCRLETQRLQQKKDNSSEQRPGYILALFQFSYLDIIVRGVEQFPNVLLRLAAQVQHEVCHLHRLQVLHALPFNHNAFVLDGSKLFEAMICLQLPYNLIDLRWRILESQKSIRKRNNG